MTIAFVLRRGYFSLYVTELAKRRRSATIGRRLAALSVTAGRLPDVDHARGRQLRRAGDTPAAGRRAGVKAGAGRRGAACDGREARGVDPRAARSRRAPARVQRQWLSIQRQQQKQKRPLLLKAMKRKVSECSRSTRSPAKGAGPRRRVRRRAMHALRHPAPALRQICSGADRAGFLVAAIREGQSDPEQLPHPSQSEAMACRALCKRRHLRLRARETIRGRSATLAACAGFLPGRAVTRLQKESLSGTCWRLERVLLRDKRLSSPPRYLDADHGQGA